MTLTRTLVQHIEALLDAANAKTATAIIDICAAEFGLDLLVVLSGARTKNAAMARHVAAYFCRVRTHLSYPEIGKVFRRDHTTIIHAFNKVSALR